MHRGIDHVAIFTLHLVSLALDRQSCKLNARNSFCSMAACFTDSSISFDSVAFRHP